MTESAHKQHFIGHPSDGNSTLPERLEKAREKKHLLKIKNQSGIDPILRAKLNPKSRKDAIAAKCCDCVGTSENPGWMTEIRKCPMTDCSLWQFRPYKQRG